MRKFALQSLHDVHFFDGYFVLCVCEEKLVDVTQILARKLFQIIALVFVAPQDHLSREKESDRHGK